MTFPTKLWFPSPISISNERLVLQPARTDSDDTDEQNLRILSPVATARASTHHLLFRQASHLTVGTCKFRRGRRAKPYSPVTECHSTRLHTLLDFPASFLVDIFPTSVSFHCRHVKTQTTPASKTLESHRRPMLGAPSLSPEKLFSSDFPTLFKVRSSLHLPCSDYGLLWTDQNTIQICSKFFHHDSWKLRIIWRTHPPILDSHQCWLWRLSPVSSKYAIFLICYFCGSLGYSVACLTLSSLLVPWVLDSGASDHISSNPRLLSYFTNVTSVLSVTFVNGSKTVVKAVGCAHQLPSLSLDFVMYILNCPLYLVPVSKLTRSLNCSFIFDNDSVVIQDRDTERMIGAWHELHGLLIRVYLLPL